MSDDAARSVGATDSQTKSFSERLLLLTLASIQFTVVVDFLIVLPLGPQYMRVFDITPAQFGLIVSSYALSAGISGVAASFFLDRLDRRPALLALYLGFTIGTLFCALAPDYHLLVAARVVAGAFGGVSGALILAIIGDVIPEARRGAAMGMVMSAFSVASIVGVPLGLVLASNLSWHVPFYGLAGVGVIVWLLALRAMPKLQGHLHHAADEHPVKRTLAVMAHKNHQMAFVFMAVLTASGFVVFPYLSNYMVGNVGMTEKQLPLIYLAGGLCTIFSMNWIGRWADRAGKRRVFIIMSLCATIPILALTNLSRVPLALAIGTSTLLMICMSGRMVPAMAMMTGSIEARYRGGFMSINSSVQQFSCGLAAFASGHIIGESATGELTRFPVVGLISVTCILSCIYLSRFLKVPDGIKANANEAALVVEHEC
jgi:predicted MFS family arabinose efflux permease